MPALDQAVAQMLLGGLAALSSFTASTGPTKLRLTMNAPTATVAGTEISGAGYTAGGLTITWGAVTGTTTGAMVLNSNAISWTNGASANWTITGAEIWDSSGTPRRLSYGVWDDAPITIGPGSVFPLAIAGLAWVFP